MESSKHVKSDSGSSEENDHQEEVKDVTKRTYECTYCKRGFTNAQALGGHMNIHRKDRAKAKQNHLHATSSISNTSNNENKLMISSSSSRSCLEPMILNDHANNSVVYQRSSMVSCPTTYDPHTSYVHEPSTIFNLGNEEHGTNLTLRIGSTYLHERDAVMQVDNQENEELDLELRLGPDP